MHPRSASTLLACAAAVPLALAQPAGPDPLQTDGDKYRAILDNACVRVLEYRDRPGEQTHQHVHPAFVLYALAPFKRTLTLPDGKAISREFKIGDVMW